MKIKAKDNASKRTRERINQHGRHGFLIAGRQNPQGGQAAWLLRSRTTKWLGWLPCDEFDLA
tara:strand:+ start:9529 stop:9714 length:186 start_codon:yes stop_codon:yes gene_type:complete